jgi:hypothetical protein
MSTRSRIGIRNDNGSITSIYCHWNGDLLWNGRTLFQSYQQEEKVRELIALGDLSQLKTHVSPLDKPETHSYETPHKDVTIAYQRDRGETGCKAFTDKNEKSYLKTANETDADYVYLYQKGTWYYNYGKGSFIELTQLQINIEKEAENQRILERELRNL